MLIHKDKKSRKSLYTVLYLNESHEIDELHFHALNLIDARRIAMRQFAEKRDSVIEVGLTIGAKEDASGIYI